MKKTILSLFVLSAFCSLTMTRVSAGTTTSNSRGDKGSSPIEILDRVAEKSNEDYNVQDTSLDGVSADDGSYSSEYKIANTLDSIRQNIAPYLQRMFYIGLGAATLLIVYNGFLLVTGAVSGEDFKKVQGRIKNIAIGILIMTGFAMIVRLFLAIVASII